MSAISGRSVIVAEIAAHLARGGVLVAGPPGCGKTTVLDDLAAASRTPVRRTSAGLGVTRLPYLGLADLLGEADAGLPGHLRRSLAGALLRGSPGGTGNPVAVDRIAVRVAAREQLARSAPLLLIVDDAHALDAESAAVLAYLAARPVDGIRVLAASRDPQVRVTDGPCVLLSLVEGPRQSVDLDEDARRAALLTAAAVRATPELLDRCGALGEPASPRLAEHAYIHADDAERAAAHADLAKAAEDPIERARHLALAAPGPSAVPALAEAAAHAERRGAPGTAAELAELAAARSVDAHERAALLLAAARSHLSSARPADAARTATEAARTGPRSVRVAARLLLAETTGSDWGAAVPHVEGACGDARGVPELEAEARLHRGVLAYAAHHYEAAATELTDAGRLAGDAGRGDLLATSLRWRAAIALRQGEPGDELLARAYQVARGLPADPAVTAVRVVWATAACLRGEVSAAVRELDEQTAATRERGTLGELIRVLAAATGVHDRAGRANEALSAGREALWLDERVHATPGLGSLAAAQGELAGGTFLDAASHASRALAVAERARDDEFALPALVVRGKALLADGDVEAAAESFARAAVLERRARAVDPAVHMWHADRAEALIGTGEPERAARLIGRILTLARARGRHTVLLGLARADAVRRAALGDSGTAVRLLTAAIDRASAHPYPMEVARAHLTLGAIERAAGHRHAAREAYLTASRRFTAAGAAPWAAKAEAALTDLADRRDLSARIVELVRTGATNREIAAELNVSVKTVEARLTGLYRRYGVRNRVELVRVLG
ncbi:hypothetical protein Afil01_24040 [Actinorhabdospora filicis]|uniref:HTH luxR-type domain-containing protein n=1 Tax=Actinorhabdospora filicis TaxID=1785913 RepID=A0A9W6SKQ5_9ACTN|nr:AAA family ATPase [Actinorhabdospora filicis]GLZ77597.1 hypothetical protein Afil01_24040 [Actinorhabdospora filicis]